MAQHISVRIPWKDNGYTGLVCNKPCYNNSCLRLKNIIENRDDEFENSIKGCSMKGHEEDVPCLVEGACFMSENSFVKTTVHPYKNNSQTHGHFLPTELVFKPYSFPVRPYGWMMTKKNDSDNVLRIVRKYGVKFDYQREPELPFETIWVQDAENQRQIFDKFYRDIEFQKSLIIPYAKQVPFLEDNKRVVMGIGFISNLTMPPEHKHNGTGVTRSMLWETMAEHTIRDDRENGFLMPYQEMMKYAETHPDFDMKTITVTVEDEFFEEFSYASEHLSYDAVISVINKTIKALKIVKSCIPGNWDHCIRWLEARLNEVWLDRGPYPGLGSMLCAIGFKSGHLMAREIRKNIEDLSQYKEELFKALSSPKSYFSKDLSNKIEGMRCKIYLSLEQEKKNYFWLLSRIALSEEQAEVLYSSSECKAKLNCQRKDIIENPYLLYEKTRLLEEKLRISVGKIDMAVFPPEIIAEIDPLDEPSALCDDNDERRIRAMAVHVLEQQCEYGHTVYPRTLLMDAINDLPINPPCEVDEDIFEYVNTYLTSEIIPVPCVNGETAYQLLRMYSFDEVIRKAVNNRMESERLNVVEKWDSIYDAQFPNDSQNEIKALARKEKIAILEELSCSKISVLLGGAGTGKTTLLALLCSSQQILSGGVLLLAPTGKASVRMSQAMSNQGIKAKAETVAQFLTKNDRFDWNTMSYRLSNTPARDIPSTVIIDESSMLTEEMFGALLQVLSPAKRIIFVGDPNQLPPIGAGRPFVDLVKHLEPENKPFPCVSRGYGKLQITMRQFSEGGNYRSDTALAEWYSDSSDNRDDSIFDSLMEEGQNKHIVFKQWETAEDLEKLIFDTVCEETGMESVDDIIGFDESLGGYKNDVWMNFDKYPEKIESWQILSAYRSNPAFGTGTINRYIHEKYRKQDGGEYHNVRKRRTPRLLGADGIVYGDKVINVRNQKKKCEYGTYGQDYVANGEVGIVDSILQKPLRHAIRFVSQPNARYSWYSTVGEEAASDIELAYALTVHKSQGSEFNKVILVLGEPGRLLSKEMLYTAITRQKDKLIILYNKPAYSLRDYSNEVFSEIARRFTCLFELPNPTEYKGKYLEKYLIHKTERGELVRSKSEVIIANMLYELGIDYQYESELDLGEDGMRIPDFTIYNPKDGVTYIWEHCGMLADDKYRNDWEFKKALYAEHGITTDNRLIVTKDGYDGSIDSQEIRKIIEEKLK